MQYSVFLLCVTNLGVELRKIYTCVGFDSWHAPGLVIYPLLVIDTFITELIIESIYHKERPVFIPECYKS